MSEDYVPFNEAYHSRQHGFEEWKKQQPHGRQGVGHCICGLRVAGQTKRNCDLHPAATVRTIGQRFDFEREWDAQVEAGKK